MASSGKFVEDELGRKWDRCLTDAVLKLGGGLAIGTVVTLLFFRRRRWPIFIGAGFGIGMAYANCERDINSTITAKCVPPKVKSLNIEPALIQYERHMLLKI